MPDRFLTVQNQRQQLEEIIGLVRKGIANPTVRETALLIVKNAGCPNQNVSSASRDQIDLCQLKAVYEAVKNGDSDVPGLEHGVPYMADPAGFDLYTAPARLLKACKAGMGSCHEDCDGLTALICALAGTLGFEAGARAWGKPGGDGYQHVFCVVKFPKREKTGELSLDVTVPRAKVGWHPPEGRIMTAWVNPQPPNPQLREMRR